MNHLRTTLLLFLLTLSASLSGVQNPWRGPDFIIIGERKCGTTSVYRHLIEHPDVMTPKKKELFFFSNNEEYLADPDLNGYRSQFQWRVNDCKKLFESTVLYLYHPLVPQRVHQHFPNARFIIMLRNPVERIFSGYKYNVKRELEERTFSQFIADEFADFPTKFSNPRGDMGREDDPLCRGLYEYSIKRWRNYFPKEQFLILFINDLATDPESLMRRIYKFIGVEEFELSDYPTYNVSISDEQMDPDTRRQLEDFYRPYNENLREYLLNEFNTELNF